ncbi:AAA family ATPase [Pseudanabaena sp. Chao 1811]|uniref:AAA family ATPase n=1 Tax=Pseudanabaena sp. Chao 1811 TaxID=2963092 RepID=UPI0022F3D38E|nr:AAA family ATPase [Pseudanabaena sp. Chao 1811]
MRIKLLRLKSFRGFENLEINFDDKLSTIFLGGNGTGKSTILDSISTMLFSVFTSLFKLKSMNLKPKVDYPFAEFNKDDISSNSGKGFISIAIKSLDIDCSIDVEIENHLESFEAYNLHQLLEDISSMYKAEGNLPLVVHYITNRIVPEIEPKFLEPVSLDDIDIREVYSFYSKIRQTNFVELFTWFRSLEDIENQMRLDGESSYRDKQLQAVRDAIANVVPEFSDLKVNRRPPAKIEVTKNNKERFSINQLSDGEKCFLAMVGDLARRLAIVNPKNDDPLKGYGIVLIDEIELHLHPEWQRRVIPRLTETFPNCQFIITTHSPQVLGEFKGQVYRLKQSESGIIAELRHTYGKDSNRILEDDMESTERDRDIQEDILQLFRHIDDGDLKAARSLKHSLQKKIGEDPTFIKADVLMHRKEVLGR